METMLAELLKRCEIEPILVDVGASGGTPRIWQPIRAYSTYIGFDGDDREIHHPQEDEFRYARFVHEVITENGAGEVKFYLTRSPYCSSTLKPNPVVTDNFLSADSFVVERETTMRASNLNDVITRLSLDRIDWMKIDTQGTDLRIYNSLRQELRDRMLAIDIEPGLRGAYVGEDLFSNVHNKLTADGFWLSNLKVCGLVRMRKTSMDALTAQKPDLAGDALTKFVRPTPGWTECRYLRSLESLAKVEAKQRDYVLLWIFASIDKQFGFCLDLALEYQRLFGKDAVSAILSEESVRQMEEALRIAQTPKTPPRITFLGRVKRKVKRLLFNP